MFVDEKAAGEKEPVKVGMLKLSEAIRKGKPIVGTESTNFSFCVIGCAWAGVKGERLSIGDLSRIYHDNQKEFLEHCGIAILRDLGYPPELGPTVSRMHTTGMPALQIADWLESRGH